MKTKPIATQTIVGITSFYAASSAVQLLVLLKVIPYDWVNGGMSQNYAAQATQSVISLIIIGLLFLLVWHVLNLQTAPKKWQRYALYVITAFWTLGFIMQIIGTPFERFVLSILLFVGVASHILLIRKLSSSNSNF